MYENKIALYLRAEMETDVVKVLNNYRSLRLAWFLGFFKKKHPKYRNYPTGTGLCEYFISRRKQNVGIFRPLNTYTLRVSLF